MTYGFFFVFGRRTDLRFVHEQMIAHMGLVQTIWSQTGPTLFNSLRRSQKLTLIFFYNFLTHRLAHMEKRELEKPSTTPMIFTLLHFSHQKTDSFSSLFVDLRPLERRKDATIKTFHNSPFITVKRVSVPRHFPPRNSRCSDPSTPRRNAQNLQFFPFS